MSKQYFMPVKDADKQHWLQNFSGKLGTYATKYNISAAQVTDTQNGSAYFNYWLNYKIQFDEYVKKLTEYKNEIRSGLPSTATVSVAPTPPVIGAAPTAVSPGIFVRATSIANIIKSTSTYTVADGNDLGIEGATDTTDPQTMKPIINVVLISGGKPEIQWKKAGMDGINIYVDRGTGTFAFLALDTYPHYPDTAPLPATGTSAVWKYKAIYHFNDTEAGMWSDVVNVTVTGS
jgi:hypothetical protein